MQPTAQFREQHEDNEWQSPFNPPPPVINEFINHTDHVASKFLDAANVLSGIRNLRKSSALGEHFSQRKWIWLIAYFDITDDNYQTALDAIDARYYDPQLLMDNEVDNLLSLLNGNFGAGMAKTQNS